MSVDFQRTGLIRREGLLLAEGRGVSDAGQLVFLSSVGAGDRVHRMDLARLRRFSMDRESKAVRVTLTSVFVVAVLGCLGVSLMVPDPAARAFLLAVFGLLLLVGIGGLARTLGRPFVSLSFEDPTRTRSVKVSASRRKLDGFEDRLRAAVALA